MQNSDPAAILIKEIHRKLQSSMKLFNQGFSTKYKSLLDSVHKLKYSQFQSCMKQFNNIPNCTQNVNKYDLSIDMGKYNLTLNTCIQDQMQRFMALQSAKQKNKGWQKNIDSCITNFQKSIIKDLEAQITRVLNI